MVKSQNLRRLETFHNRCVRSIVGVTRHQQWQERISSRQLAEDLGMEEKMSDMLAKHCLRWLGHVARVNDSQSPKQILFGKLHSKRPCHGAKRR